MEIRFKKCKSGNIWKFVNESWSNSNGWGHKTTVFKNSYDYEPHRVKYLNRTWECYTYQTCMRGAVASIFYDEANRFIENYKDIHNITRFKKGEKQRVIEFFKGTTMGQDLQELKDAIDLREFSSIEVQ